MSGEAWVAVVSVIVAGITSSLALWLTFIERRAGYSQSLYDKQVEVYHEMLNTLGGVYGPTYETISMLVGTRRATYDDGSDRYEPMRAKALERFERIREQEGVWLSFISKTVANEYEEFRIKAKRGAYPLDFHPDLLRAALHELPEAYTNLVTAIRDDMGIEPLSKETQELISRAR